MKAYALLNMKGGVGKTTTSLNVATGLSMLGYKTLLIDFDPQANTTDTFIPDNQEPAITVDKLIFEPSLTNEAIINVMPNLDLIPSSIDLAETELNLSVQRRFAQHNRLQMILKEVENEYDFIFIDCQPIINTLTINVILASDMIIIPVKPEKYAIRGFQATVNNIIDVKNGFEARANFKLLVTMRNRIKNDVEIITQLKEMNIPMYQTEIRYQAKPVTDAANNDKLLIQSKSNVSLDYQNLVKEVENEWQTPTGK